MLKKSLLCSLVALLLAACADSPNNASPVTAAPPPFPAIYNPELQPHPLTSSQFHDIQSRATHAHAAPIWFVYIPENDGTHYRASVYFVPTVHNGRVCHGQCANFLSATRDELDFMEKAGMSAVAIDSYTCITDHPVDAAAPLPPPSESNLPFRTPERIPDADLPKILDAARTIFAQHPATPTAPAVPALPPMPVRNIFAGPNGRIRVIFGWMTAPRTGHGIQVELQQHGDEFIVLSADQWAS